MRFVPVRWLLCAVAVAAAATKMQQSTTPRYNTHVGSNTFNKSRVSVINRENYIPNSVRLVRVRDRNSVGGWGGFDRSRKIRLQPVQLTFKNSTNDKYFKLKFNVGNETNLVPVTVKQPAKRKPNVSIKRARSTTVIPKTAKRKTTHKNNLGHYRNYTKVRIKPDVKQADEIFYNVVSPIPRPEISTYSPEYGIGDASPISNDVRPNPEISTYSPQFSLGSLSDAQSSSEGGFARPVSQVILQSIPSNTGTKDSLPDDCPTVQLSSYVYGPEQGRQGCSDLNVVINSHVHQNVITERIQALQSEPVATASDPVAYDQEAAPAAADAAPAAAPATNAGGGNPIGFPPQLPGLPEFPELSLPDLKGLFDALGFVWRLLSPVFGFFGNPYLYAVPAIASFALGFFKLLGLFPWWVFPLYFYATRDKSDDEQKVKHYTHVHKPVHHKDGWFWNHNAKAWENIFDRVRKDRVDDVSRSIDDFRFKYS